MSDKTIYPGLFGPEGHLNEEGTALFVDALFLGKTDRLPGPIVEHVSHCETCRAEVSGLNDLISENKALFPQVTHPMLDSNPPNEQDVQAAVNENSGVFRRLTSAWSIAAAVVILLGFGAVMVYNAFYSRDAQIRREIVEKIIPGEGEELKPGQEETLHYASNVPIPSAMVGNLKLEAMFNLQLRGDGFSLKSPKKITKVSLLDKISWEWSSSSEIEKLTLMVMDEAGINRNQITLTQKKYEFIVDLPAGLYYWVIVGDGDLLSVGKFTVINDH